MIPQPRTHVLHEEVAPLLHARLCVACVNCCNPGAQPHCRATVACTDCAVVLGTLPMPEEGGEDAMSHWANERIFQWAAELAVQHQHLDHGAPVGPDVGRRH